MSSTKLEILVRGLEQFRAAFINRILPRAKEIWADGDDAIVSIISAEHLKTRKQRGYMHVCLFPEIAAQVRPRGEQFSMLVWKEHYRKEFLGTRTDESINPLTGEITFEEVRVSTEDLGIRKTSEYIDRVSAHAATEFGVVFSVPNWESYIMDSDLTA
jgi:hypothetical protein